MLIGPKGLEVELDRVSLGATVHLQPETYAFARLASTVWLVALTALGFWTNQMGLALVAIVGLGLAYGWVTRPRTGRLVADEHGIALMGKRFEYAGLRTQFTEIREAGHYGLLRVKQAGSETAFRMVSVDPDTIERWVALVNERALTAEAATIDTEALDRARALVGQHDKT